MQMADTEMNIAWIDSTTFYSLFLSLTFFLFERACVLSSHSKPIEDYLSINKSNDSHQMHTEDIQYADLKALPILD